MAMIFADTNIIIEYFKGNESTIKKLDNYEHVYINDVVLMELFQGARDILEKYTLSHNTKIMDAIITATTISYNLKLYTLNKKILDI